MAIKQSTIDRNNYLKQFVKENDITITELRKELYEEYKNRLNRFNKDVYLDFTDYLVSYIHEYMYDPAFLNK